MKYFIDIREIINIVFALFVIGTSVRFWRKSKKQNEQISSSIEENKKLIEQTRFLITKTTDLLEESKKIYRDRATARNRASIRQSEQQDMDLKESAKEFSQFIDDPELQQKITDEFGFSYYEDNGTDNSNVGEKKENCSNLEEYRNEIDSF